MLHRCFCPRQCRGQAEARGFLWLCGHRRQPSPYPQYPRNQQDGALWHHHRPTGQIPHSGTANRHGRLVALDTTLTSSDTLVIRLRPETITLREVTVLPFTNYETFKEMLITMPSIETPDEIKRMYDDLDDLWLSRVPAGNGKPTLTANPIQYLYDKYNASARRQATLLRNRRMYNEVLREQGRTDELLPDSLDFAIDYKIYELDEAAESRKNMNVFDTTEVVGKVKPMVPRKKYIHFGQ